MQNQANNEILLEPVKDEMPLQKVSLLKKTRETQGLTLEAVHEATKIPLDVLRAIEEGYTVRIVSPFYYRGFVKMYAQYLNINVREVLGEEVKEKESLSKYNTRPKKESWEFEQWFSPFFTKERKRQFFISLAVLLGVIFTWKAAAFVITNRPSKPLKERMLKKEESKAQKPKKAKVDVPTSHRAVPTAAVKPIPAAATLASNVSLSSANISLTLRARKNSWLSVKADGQTVFQGTLNIGSVETWTASEKVEISGTNLNQLEFELNGKMVGTLGRAERKAKAIVITKDGLKVTK